ncbi:DUF2971 domain-containing protein [Pantoea agglomerans]|jgi:hypothetical protein|uniref:DUF2971 domain-containing protein n=3 Tax=Enterobacter agglomerans TaxID=549 RepID=UPI003C7AE9B0
MTRFLYKYMKLRPDFFSNPMIRATPAKHLNDPFEGCFNKEQVRDAHLNHQNYFGLLGKDVYEDSVDYAVKNSMGEIESDINELGVISLTESYNNTLMWAHYGDEHKGVVVEFDFSVPFFSSSIHDIDGRSMRFKKDFMATCFEMPEKVDYRRMFPDFKRPEFSNPDEPIEFHWNKFYQTILFTKSIDWIYEQEQRSIVRLHDADVMICKDNEFIRSACMDDADIVLEKYDEENIKIIFPDEYEMREEMGDHSIKMEVFRRINDADAMFFFRINPLAISSVYFGCKANFNKSILNILNNTSLKQLDNVHIMVPGENLYQFLPRRISFRRTVK